MGARRGSSVPPPGPPTRLTTGGPYPSAGPQLRSVTISRHAILPPATNVTFQEKTALLVKFNFFHYFKDSANSKQERARCNSPVSVKETCLRENKGVAANAIQALGSGARPRRRAHPPEPRLPRRQEGSGPERCSLWGRRACTPLSRTEGSGHRPPPSASSLRSLETRARARLGECSHMAAPLRKGQPPHRGRARTPQPPARRGDTTFQSPTGRREARLCDPARPHRGLAEWRGNRAALFFFFFFQKGKNIWVREQDSGGGHSRPLAPNPLPKSLRALWISAPSPRGAAPCRGQQGRGSRRRLGPFRGKSGRLRGALPAPRSGTGYLSPQTHKFPGATLPST